MLYTNGEYTYVRKCNNLLLIVPSHSIASSIKYLAHCSDADVNRTKMVSQHVIVLLVCAWFLVVFSGGRTFHETLPDSV